MYYCKDLFSLSVLSLYEGELIGKVDKLYFDENLKKLIEIEISAENGASMFLPTKNIYRVGKNAITVKNNQAISVSASSDAKVFAPIGIKAYSINGEFLGVVHEIKINEKFSSDKIVLENDKLMEIKDVASCGKNTIIFKDSRRKTNIKSFIPGTFPKTLKGEESIVNIMPIKNETDRPVKAEEGRAKTIQDSSFLVGRVCERDLFNFNNELLIKANTVITKKNLKEIIRFGKLRELMLFTK